LWSSIEVMVDTSWADASTPKKDIEARADAAVAGLIKVEE
jgi:hypothetical protein